MSFEQRLPDTTYYELQIEKNSPDTFAIKSVCLIHKAFFNFSEGCFTRSL